MKKLFLILLIAVGLGAAGWHFYHQPAQTVQSAKTAVAKIKSAVPSICAKNSAGKKVTVSISQRRMWACSGTSQVYTSAVITGMENIPADLTPVGTYTVYAKQTDQHLIGSDSTGSWNDFVYYWMPFLVNKYGTYGFHDATWRKATDFGNISPYSSNASHGCVELPLATAKWLYGWASIGLKVSIVS